MEDRDMSAFTNPAKAAATAGESYVRALLRLLGDDEPMEVLAEQPAVLRSLTRGVPRRALRRPEAPGKWSIVEVVQHLADSEVVFGYRLRMALAHEQPRLEGFDQDLWAARLHYRDATLGSAMGVLLPLRAAHLRLLRSLGEDELRRVAVHAERGPGSVKDMVRMAAAHDLVHRRQIARIARSLGAG
ncbi:MAG TPA: DinB family protein [Thermoanaerobaculia bacterium]|nr:DinB family protein [Thermoanaerobaculia bacterium]